MRRVFRFKNSLALAKIILAKNSIVLQITPYDDRLPVREMDFTSIDEALTAVFEASEQTDSFQCDFIYTDDDED